MITNKKHLSSPISALFWSFFSDNSTLSDLLFFDIETTGLSPKSSQVFLIGALQYDKSSQTFEMLQFLAEDSSLEEECQLLEQFCQLAEKKQVLVHFNGNSFDLPYLRQRCQKLAVFPVFDSCASVDLYRELLRMPAFFRQMPEHKQKSFEQLVNYPRTDTCSGKDMITLFKAYADSHEEKIRHPLLLHNEDDLKGMLALLPLGGLKQLQKGDFQPVDVKEITESTYEGTKTCQVLFTCTLSLPLPTQLSARTNFCYITAEQSLLKIKVPVFEGTLRYFYPDYKNYYYLPYEDEAIHKSIAAYTDATRRQRATAATCYKNINGRFLYAPGTPELPLLKESYSSKEHYVLWPFSDSSPSALKSFLIETLKTAITQK